MMFSVIVPVYNAEKYLRPCLDSVLAQTFSDWECVCVDDGSKDASGNILDEYAAKDMRFVVVHQVNGGEGVARNTGMSVARGEWITWLDADDLYAPDRLQEAEKIIRAENPDVIRFRTVIGRPGQVGFAERPVLSNKCKIYSGFEAKRWGWDVLVRSGMVWMWIARRSVLSDTRFRPGMKVKVDGVYCGQFSNRLEKVVQCEYYSYFYRYVSTSAIHSERFCADTLRVLDAFLDVWTHCCSGITHPLLMTVIRQRIRSYCEGDIVDWTRLGHDLTKDNINKVHAAYMKLLSAGLGAERRTIAVYCRIPLVIFERFGVIWPLFWVVQTRKTAVKIYQSAKIRLKRV